MAMVTRKRPPVAFTPVETTVSGATYSLANLAEYPLKPISSRKVGGFGGVQYKYRIETRLDYDTFVDHLAESACVTVDRGLDAEPIYRDMERF